MKQLMVKEIEQKLVALMLPVVIGGDTDLSIQCEFLDASWGAGSRKINYETAIFLNESDKQILMFEKTVEIGGGISFGGSSDSTIQSGTTLFRKVKSIQYGPDGKAFDYNLDLGAIPKAVKDTAKQYGWKFKTVLSRNKACYPAGYLTGIDGALGGDLGSAAPPAGPKRKFGILRTLGFGLLSLTTVLFFALMSVNLMGWLIGFATLFVTLLLLKLSVGKGLFMSLLIFLISFVTLFFVMSYSIPDTIDSSSLGNPVEQNDSTPAAETPVDHSQSAFYIEYLDIDSSASTHYDSAQSYSKGALSVQSRVILGLNTHIPYYSNGSGETQNDTNIIKATLNVTPVKVPIGKFVAYRFLGYDSIALNPQTLANQTLPPDYVLPVYGTYDEATAKEESGEGNYILYLVGETQSVQLRFGTAILDILPSEDFSQKTSDQFYTDSLALALSKGYTSEALRHRVRISLLLESKNGKKHLIEFERDILPDGYEILTTKPGGTSYEEKSDGNPQNAKDDLFSKIVN